MVTQVKMVVRTGKILALATCLLGLMIAGGSPPAWSADTDRAAMACLKQGLTAADFAAIRKARESGQEPTFLSDAANATVHGCLLTNGASPAKASARPPRLTVSPMDPSRVTSMSRFRSCAGHDYSGPTVNGPREANRSMKTYLYVNAPWTDAGTVSVRAPFAGTVYISQEGDNPLGSWVRVVNDSGWAFTIFHSDPAVRNGQRIRAGAALATFPPRNAPTAIPDRLGEPEANFDFSLESTDGRRALFVDYLTPKAASAWKARGFTGAALKISRAERDAAPCTSDYPDFPGSAGFVSPVG